MKFIHTFILSVISGIVIDIIFYILSVRKSAVSEYYTSTDTYLGLVFLFILVLIIGLSLFPKIIEILPSKNNS